MARFLGLVVAGMLSLAFLGGCSSSSPPSTFGTGGGTTAATGGGGGAIPCSAGMAFCSGVCVIPDDANNCGGCGLKCGAGQVCVNRTCGTSCGALLMCGTACVDPKISPLNCGGCNLACPSGQCANGACVTGPTGSGGGSSVSSGGGTTGMTTGGTTGSATGGNGGVISGGGTRTGGAGGGMTTGGTSSGNTGGSGNIGNTGGTTSGNTGGGGNVGGSGNTGGTTSGNTGGSGNVAGGDPPGYVHWGSDWAGCAWTGKDTLKVGTNTVDGSTITLTQATTISPQDFTALAPGDNFCAKGTVGDAYEAVALLGFNITEPAATADCTYDPNAAEAKADPGVAPTSGMKGIAVNISSNVASSLRIQIQGPDGGTDANDRWCYDLNASGSGGGEKAFAPYTDFYTKCWGSTTAEKGNKYNNEPISAVVFLVPGTPAPTPYEYCVIGFAEGNAASDAPDGSVDLGATKGTIGGGCDDTTSKDLDYQRKRITAGGKQYIIQNNNWGNWANSCQTLDFEGNGFTVTKSTGTSPDGAAPASFPSIYVGRNGDTANGTMTTVATDHLPKTIGSITSAKTTFAWSGSSGGDFNVSYDVWFASDNPPNGGKVYEDAVSGFIMLWLYDPSSRQPVGSDSG
jgi:hypothetical protein